MADSSLRRLPARTRRDFDCSIGFGMAVIGSKWRAIILWHILKDTPIRYSQLKQHIDAISHKILAQELKQLEADCLITRTVYPVIPPKVEYSPTEKGLALQPMLTSLCAWGKKYRQP